jgi:hypothetical protein
MGSCEKNRITRRNFVKGMAVTTIYCACFPMNSLADSAGNSASSIKEVQAKGHLAAACGTYCGACPAYIAKHSQDEQIKKNLQKRQTKRLEGVPPSNWMDGLLCDGCVSGGKLAGHCQRCNIRLCALNNQDDSRCSDCEELPCYRITNLINMGSYLHRKEYLPNLKKIREMGVQEWVKYEEERWRCSNCRLPMSWYDSNCTRCGNVRSGLLFPIPEG